MNNCLQIQIYKILHEYLVLYVLLFNIIILYFYNNLFFYNVHLIYKSSAFRFKLFSLPGPFQPGQIFKKSGI